jgi:hypothetical protein
MISTGNALVDPLVYVVAPVGYYKSKMRTEYLSREFGKFLALLISRAEYSRAISTETQVPISS